jgi:hypothetical protein
MFAKELMILGLRKQLHSLDELVNQLEEKPSLDLYDRQFSIRRTNEIVQNLQRLREIKSNYAPYLN